MTVQWNPVSEDTKGTYSVRIIRVSVLNVLSEKNVIDRRFIDFMDLLEQLLDVSSKRAMRAEDNADCIHNKQKMLKSKNE